MAEFDPEAEVQPVVDWLSKWESKKAKRGAKAVKKAAGKGRSTAAQEVRALQRKSAANMQQDPAISVMKAMRAVQPGEQGLVAGGNLIETGKLPQSFRDSLPRDQQWIGLDPGLLDDAGMQYLIKLHESGGQ